MATSITKTYSVTVTYKYIDGRTITAADMNVANLRALILKVIGERSNWQKGDINAVPGTVTEA